MRGLVGFAGEWSRGQVGAGDRAGLERDGGEASKEVAREIMGVDRISQDSVDGEKR